MTLLSFYSNDFQFCECGAVGIDGGLDYLKRILALIQQKYITKKCQNMNDSS
ncbi:DUF7695 domain-containing protein [Lysinibacillus sp. NPDC048646]|uniref:DUF7695 domain-containing protein n=1 Tax=Lysinibacillus sp. NPDC048646 TaxID=3390574 RepID=UPI003D01B742